MYRPTSSVSLLQSPSASSSAASHVQQAREAMEVGAVPVLCVLRREVGGEGEVDAGGGQESEGILVVGQPMDAARELDARGSLRWALAMVEAVGDVAGVRAEHAIFEDDEDDDEEGIDANEIRRYSRRRSTISQARVSTFKRDIAFEVCDDYVIVLFGAHVPIMSPSTKCAHALMGIGNILHFACGPSHRWLRPGLQVEDKRRLEAFVSDIYNVYILNNENDGADEGSSIMRAMSGGGAGPSASHDTKKNNAQTELLATEISTINRESTLVPSVHIDDQHGDGTQRQCVLALSACLTEAEVATAYVEHRALRLPGTLLDMKQGMVVFGDHVALSHLPPDLTCAVYQHCRIRGLLGRRDDDPQRIVLSDVFVPALHDTNRGACDRGVLLCVGRGAYLMCLMLRPMQYMRHIFDRADEGNGDIEDSEDGDEYVDAPEIHNSIRTSTELDAAVTATEKLRSNASLTGVLRDTLERPSPNMAADLSYSELSTTGVVVADGAALTISHYRGAAGRTAGEEGGQESAPIAVMDFVREMCSSRSWINPTLLSGRDEENDATRIEHPNIPNSGGRGEHLPGTSMTAAAGATPTKADGRDAFAEDFDRILKMSISDFARVTRGNFAGMSSSSPRDTKKKTKKKASMERQQSPFGTAFELSVALGEGGISLDDGKKDNHRPRWRVTTRSEVEAPLYVSYSRVHS